MVIEYQETNRWFVPRDQGDKNVAYVTERVCSFFANESGEIKMLLIADFVINTFTALLALPLFASDVKFFLSRADTISFYLTNTNFLKYQSLCSSNHDMCL